MPQSTEELRALMTRWFGDISDGPPLALLFSQGFTEDGHGLLRSPVETHSWTEVQWACARFLVEEWDYDVLRGARQIELRGEPI